MQCKKCNAQLSEESKFCQKCGTQVDQVKENKNVPWHQNIKWWGLLIVSLICWIIYYPDGGYLWYFLFLIGFIFSLVQFIKEDYFKLNAKKSGSRKVLKTIVGIGYIFVFFLIVALISYIAGQ